MRRAGNKPGRHANFKEEDNINKIKEARLAAGLTQKSMSEKTGIPMRTIGDWETGHRCPPEWAKLLVIEKLHNIAKAAAK